MTVGALQVLVVWLVMGIPIGTGIGLAIARSDGAPHPEIAPSRDRLPR